MLQRVSVLTLATAVLVFLAGCDTTDSEPEPDPIPLQTQMASDVEADPSMGGGGGPPTSSGRYTLYDLETGTIVLSSSVTDQAVRAADSSSVAWDIGFNSTTIIINGGVSGPGQGTAQIVESLFDEVTEAPTAGYVADGSNADCDAGLAVCPGSDNGWYNYNFMTNIVAPLPGRVIVMTTGEGNYAKIRILNYYQGNPADIDPFSDPSRYYTFEYIVQPDGSRDFETTTEGT
ncbi:MAG: HmuY family protein [Bacteroidota bacterium]